MDLRIALWASKWLFPIFWEDYREVMKQLSEVIGMRWLESADLCLREVLLNTTARRGKSKLKELYHTYDRDTSPKS